MLRLIMSLPLGLIATGLGKLILPYYMHYEQIKKPTDAVDNTIVNIFALASRINH